MIFPELDLYQYMKKFWQWIEKIFGVYRWHPKIALRYLPVVKELKKHGCENDVLEVGSGGLGISPYLKCRVVGVDTEFHPPIYDKLIPVAGFAQQLPFAEGSFAAVISLDMLEHIPPSDRSKVIREMVRVAKNFICLGAPMGEAAHKQDQKLRREYKEHYGEDFKFLQEQVEYGVPDEKNTIDQIRKAAASLNRRVDIRSIGNINLKFRLFLMRGWMTRNALVNFIFRKFFILLIPVYLTFNNPPTYRKLIFVELNE